MDLHHRSITQLIYSQPPLASRAKRHIADRTGFEPAEDHSPVVFKTTALSPSATYPYQKAHLVTVRFQKLLPHLVDEICAVLD